MAKVPVRQDLLDLIFQSDSHLSNLFGHATWFVKLLFSIILIVAIVALIINITKLAMSGGNPQARSEAIRNIFIAGCCMTVLGGLGLIFTLLTVFI